MGYFILEFWQDQGLTRNLLRFLSHGHNGRNASRPISGDRLLFSDRF
ncbi:hypothetical protein [Picosynechococcus sp. PCC 7002]